MDLGIPFEGKHSGECSILDALDQVFLNVKAKYEQNQPNVENPRGRPNKRSWEQSMGMFMDSIPSFPTPISHETQAEDMRSNLKSTSTLEPTAGNSIRSVDGEPPCKIHGSTEPRENQNIDHQTHQHIERSDCFQVEFPVLSLEEFNGHRLLLWEDLSPSSTNEKHRDSNGENSIESNQPVSLEDRNMYEAYLKSVLETNFRKSQGESCRYCSSRIYYRRHDLVRHIRTDHLFERRFACPICSTKFKRKAHVDSHIQSIHEENLGVVCKYCNKKYSSDSSRRKHIRVIHKTLMYD
jgi:DNA-directed RNA polymerase subunit RPC12/RpoP